MKSIKHFLVIGIAATLVSACTAEITTSLSPESEETVETEVTTTPDNSGQATTVGISDIATITGAYAVDGTNPDGSQYFGRVDVEEGANGTVNVAWEINQDTWTGRGSITDDGKLYVRYEGGFSGDGTWTLMPNGDLDGVWQADGADQSGTEIWTK